MHRPQLGHHNPAPIAAVFESAAITAADDAHDGLCASSDWETDDPIWPAFNPPDCDVIPDFFSDAVEENENGASVMDTAQTISASLDTPAEIFSERQMHCLGKGHTSPDVGASSRVRPKLNTLHSAPLSDESIWWASTTETSPSHSISLSAASPTRTCLASPFNSIELSGQRTAHTHALSYSHPFPSSCVTLSKSSSSCSSSASSSASLAFSIRPDQQVYRTVISNRQRHVETQLRHLPIIPSRCSQSRPANSIAEPIIPISSHLSREASSTSSSPFQQSQQRSLGGQYSDRTHDLDREKDRTAWWQTSGGMPDWASVLLDDESLSPVHLEALGSRPDPSPGPYSSDRSRTSILSCGSELMSNAPIRPNDHPQPEHCIFIGEGVGDEAEEEVLISSPAAGLDLGPVDLDFDSISTTLNGLVEASGPIPLDIDFSLTSTLPVLTTSNTPIHMPTNTMHDSSSLAMAKSQPNISTGQTANEFCATNLSLALADRKAIHDQLNRQVMTLPELLLLSGDTDGAVESTDGEDVRIERDEYAEHDDRAGQLDSLSSSLNGRFSSSLTSPDWNAVYASLPDSGSGDSLTNGGGCTGRDHIYCPSSVNDDLFSEAVVVNRIASSGAPTIGQTEKEEGLMTPRYVPAGGVPSVTNHVTIVPAYFDGADANEWLPPEPNLSDRLVSSPSHIASTEALASPFHLTHYPHAQHQLHFSRSQPRQKSIHQQRDSDLSCIGLNGILMTNLINSQIPQDCPASREQGNR
ncbi:unnamed protein product [Protopolystoma xenopodis]|uniref:Uncharacterized protein n=1 Tax=Protopolystoma xenopodis TaxID=117903 RepID=A0A3S5BKN1_9PLAT|nr:unnamed protein product [Protopolystoma xenopodis]